MTSGFTGSKKEVLTKDEFSKVILLFPIRKYFRKKTSLITQIKPGTVLQYPVNIINFYIWIKNINELCFRIIVSIRQHSTYGAKCA